MPNKKDEGEEENITERKKNGNYKPLWSEEEDIGTGSEIYKGDYYAEYLNYATNDSPKSWANVEPQGPVLTTKFNKINGEKALFLARQYDRDIDGKTGTGNTLCKEGSESFTYGANYSGIRGVNISEVSGLSASYVRGKRVSWLDGDSWSYQKGGDSHSESDLKNITTDIKTDNITSKTDSRGQVKTESRAVLDNTSIRMAAADVNTLNMGANSNEVIIFGACQNAYIGAAKGTVNIQAFSATINFIGNFFEYTHGLSKTVIGGYKYTTINKDSSLLNINLFNHITKVNKNSTDVIKITAENLGIKITTLETKFAEIEKNVEHNNSNIKSSNENIESINNHISDTNTAINNIKTNLQITDHNISKAKLQVTNYKMNTCLGDITLFN